VVAILTKKGRRRREELSAGDDRIVHPGLW
jgi:hypothetical protein